MTTTLENPAASAVAENIILALFGKEGRTAARTMMGITPQNLFTLPASPEMKGGIYFTYSSRLTANKSNVCSIHQGNDGTYVISWFKKYGGNLRCIGSRAGLDLGDIYSVWRDTTACESRIPRFVSVASTPKFRLGRIVYTQGVKGRFTDDEIHAAIDRHASGDWGDVQEDSVAMNNAAVIGREQNTIFSMYTYRGNKMFVITEWDKSATTLLLPEEY